MKFMANMKKEKKDNRGFSLVELIIVIAIMAILVGIVGTQVIPYLNRSRESKDLQLLNSYSTAAVSAYSINAEKITIPASNKLTVDVYANAGGTGSEAIIADEVVNLTGYANINALQDKMSSTAGKAVSAVVIEFDFGTGTVTVTGTGAEAIGTVTSYI
ncbi:MAG: type II secretion system protein [Roseburia sp.]|nr:type II secretion system protein [Roseburia sp.]